MVTSFVLLVCDTASVVFVYDICGVYGAVDIGVTVGGVRCAVGNGDGGMFARGCTDCGVGRVVVGIDVTVT